MISAILIIFIKNYLNISYVCKACKDEFSDIYCKFLWILGHLSKLVSPVSTSNFWFETFIQRIFNFSPPIIDHWNQFYEERGVLKAELRASTFLQDRGQGRGKGLNRVQCCGNSTCNRKLWFPENEILTFHNININTSIIYILLEDLIYCCLVLGLCLSASNIYISLLLIWIEIFISFWLKSSRYEPL